MIGEGTYHIGQYTFDSYEEYLDGQEDMELIKHLIHEVDFDDPEQVVRTCPIGFFRCHHFQGKLPYILEFHLFGHIFPYLAEME